MLFLKVKCLLLDSNTKLYDVINLNKEMQFSIFQADGSLSNPKLTLRPFTKLK